MAEELAINNSSKEENYKSLIPQIKALCSGESNAIANQANIVSALKQAFNFFWVGFYWVDSQEELVLGPFQGPIACTRIRKGKGVCGTSWSDAKTLVVNNVEEFPGHIACSSESKSEIVVPIIKNNSVVGVLDVDSDRLSTFDDVDSHYLNELCKWISTDIL
tara:strand:- start:166078 stop:166563 length:486 start_codon:yes stop_codon:yes gene_type:complete